MGCPPVPGRPSHTCDTPRVKPKANLCVVSPDTSPIVRSNERRESMDMMSVAVMGAASLYAVAMILFMRLAP